MIEGNRDKFGLVELFEGEYKKEYSCPECSIAYDTTVRNRMPAVAPIDTNMDYMCVGCLKGRVTDKNSIKPCPDKISEMKKTQAAWEKNWYESRSIKPLSNSPVNFQCGSVNKFLNRLKDLGDDIAAVLPSMITDMLWDNEEAEIGRVFQLFPSNWFAMRNISDQTIATIGCMKPSIYDEHSYKLRWVGVLNNIPCRDEIYLTFFDQIISLFKIKYDNDSRMSDEVKIQCFFDRHRDQHWYELLIDKCAKENISFDTQDIQCDDGSEEIKLVIYPIADKNNPHIDQSYNPDFMIELSQTVEKAQKTECDKLLQNGLRETFRTYADYFYVMDENNRDRIYHARVKDFNEHPENFFVYEIDKVVKGFVQFRCVDNATIEIEKCAMDNSCLMYADHFIEQFLQWAKRELIIENRFPAKGITKVVMKYVPDDLKLALIGNCRD